MGREPPGYIRGLTTQLLYCRQESRIRQPRPSSCNIRRLELSPCTVADVEHFHMLLSPQGRINHRRIFGFWVYSEALSSSFFRVTRHRFGCTSRLRMASLRPGHHFRAAPNRGRKVVSDWMFPAISSVSPLVVTPEKITDAERQLATQRAEDEDIIVKRTESLARPKTQEPSERLARRLDLVVIQIRTTMNKRGPLFLKIKKSNVEESRQLSCECVGRNAGELAQSPHDDFHGSSYVVPIETVPIQVDALK
jgi:hypothetical protein